MEPNEISQKVIGAAIEVHKALGPGLLESTYEACLCYEFDMRGITYQQQVVLPVVYKGKYLDCGYRIDILVANLLVVELKSVENIQPIHEAQLLTYLKLGGWNIGLLINFNVPILKHGIRRMVFNYHGPVPVSERAI